MFGRRFSFKIFPKKLNGLCENTNDSFPLLNQFHMANVWATTMNNENWVLWAGIETVSAVIMKTAWEFVFKLNNCEGNEDNDYYYSFEKRIQNLSTFIQTQNVHLIPWLNSIAHFKNFNWSFFAHFRTKRIIYNLHI